MQNYNHKEIEKKWQKRWEEMGLYRADDNSPKEKKYILDMFPYPSGAGLHVGHVESYTATDIYSRYLRMNGFNVLHPQGWDAFGLPAENYAIKTGIHPAETTKEAINNFIRQINSLGLSYDWSREINTSDPAYYKWTQWMFLLFYKNGLAFKKKGKVNWCENCQTVLANEQAEGGKCERCGNQVIQKDLEQWFFKITDFIEDQEIDGKKINGLLSGLDKVDWPESTKSAQKNWIGKSEGAEFALTINNSQLTINVYTTRLDTVFGMTYVVVAPEHEIINKITNDELKITNHDEIVEYIEQAKKKTDLERTELAKEKTGVELKGIKAINPFTNEEVPVFVADYVLGGYGTGAVMAVPAHDERDFEFAKKYGLPIKKSVESNGSRVIAIKKSLKDDFYREVQKFAQIVEDDLVCIYTEEVDKVFDMAEENFVGGPWYIHSEGPVKKILFHAENNKRMDWDDKEKWQEAYEHGLSIGIKKEQLDWASSYIAKTEDGILVDSGEFTGLTSAEAREKMAEWLEKENIGKKKVNYKLRDWLVSRQRYWGAPIPIIYCEHCGAVPVPEEDLPVKLPTDVDFKPTGESPLKYSKEFQDVNCPKCGAKARRESDTMDTFVCSSWYYLRYADPKNEKEFASQELTEKWLPVDVYVGGAEHAVMHLLYVRFFAKVLQKYGYIGFNEPFLKLRHQGIILGEDGNKMSKSKGNVVNPDEVVEVCGADALRMYEMFMGPLEDMKPWNTKGIVGIQRFLEKVWKLSEKELQECDGNHELCKTTPIELKQMLHKTIKKVTEDIEDFRFNTAISQMMIFVNLLGKHDKFPKKILLKFLVLLAPFAPHIAEELYAKMGGQAESIFREIWPKYNPAMIKEDITNLVVQVNSKARDVMSVPTEITEEEVKSLALGNEKIQKWMEGKEIAKTIFVKGKLINFVLK